jgi:curved DNA-binding protein CbpA
MPDQIDPYKILQVDSEAEDEVIQAAYRRLARKYHPDVNPGDKSFTNAPIYVTTGGVFNAATSPTIAPVGTASLTFTSCTAATIWRH